LVQPSNTIAGSFGGKSAVAKSGSKMRMAMIPRTEAMRVVTVYATIVFHPTLPARPTLIISTTEMMTLMKTKGKMTHLRARMKRTPTRPIHLIALSLESSSGVQKLKPCDDGMKSNKDANGW
jgi:hypothetical protein